MPHLDPETRADWTTAERLAGAARAEQCGVSGPATRRAKRRPRGFALIALLAAAWLVAAGCGEVTTAPASSSCRSNETVCAGECVDVEADHDHCGACDHACGPAESCDHGQCALQCGAGTTSCNGACVDLADDPESCGACGHACGDGESCVAGACVVDCGPGVTACAGACVVTSLDPANCGECGHACGPGEACSDGTCVLGCGPGITDCDGSCIDTAVDPANCGDCGHACAPGEACAGGVCTIACGAGTTDCGGFCADTAVDPANCGACGNACVAGESCVAGSCVVSCGGGSKECGGVCVDTKLDPANCGACGNACAPGLVCSGGTCQLDCTGGTTKCGDACSDTAHDPANCGACGVACPANQACFAGVCSPCAPGLTSCSGTCVNLSNDVAHCGGCASPCPYKPNATLACNGGQCQYACNPGYADCSGSGYCKTSLSSDRQNCGACGHVCAADEYCSAGTCVDCGAGKLYCNGCVASDWLHCGACDNQCPFVGPYTKPTCDAGTCGWVCSPGHENCNGFVEDGCEVNVLSDPKNCGGCGQACPEGDKCSSGTCEACPPGEAVCGDLCVDLSSSMANCGACGVSCAGLLPYGFGSCISSTCSVVCNTFHLDCDGSALDGCETPPSLQNCGACGAACSPGEFCANTACETCSPVPLGPGVPATVTGTTIGGTDQFTTSCGPQAAPDVYFSFTAPAAGTYVFDTFGSSFDTVLAVRLQDCSGLELVCNNNYNGKSVSKVSVSLAAGQTIIVIVDGYAGSQGPFVLNVN